MNESILLHDMMTTVGRKSYEEQKKHSKYVIDGILKGRYHLKMMSVNTIELQEQYERTQ